MGFSLLLLPLCAPVWVGSGLKSTVLCSDAPLHVPMMLRMAHHNVVGCERQFWIVSHCFHSGAYIYFLFWGGEGIDISIILVRFLLHFIVSQPQYFPFR